VIPREPTGTSHEIRTIRAVRTSRTVSPPLNRNCHVSATARGKAVAQWNQELPGNR